MRHSLRGGRRLRSDRDAYLHFSYPFLLKVPGYDVRATGLSAAQRDRNLETLRFISDETALRGLHFQLGLWTHAYLWMRSPDANHRIENQPYFVVRPAAGAPDRGVLVMAAEAKLHR